MGEKIVISNYAHYHTPYQVEALIETDRNVDIEYYTGANPTRIKKICNQFPKNRIHNYFYHFACKRVLKKYTGIIINNNNILDENKYEKLVSRKIRQYGNAIKIFHAFNGSALMTMATLPKNVIKIVECGVHPRYYAEICNEERRKYNIEGDSLSKAYIEKSEKEFEMADYIITLSDVCRKSFMQNKITENKIIQLPIGSDTKNYKNCAERNDVFTILYVGRVTVLKGVQYLLDACEQLIANGINIRCEIVGPVTDQYMLKQKKKYDGNKRIIFVGQQSSDELKYFYSRASVMVMPSLIDSFCMSVYESLACMTPVIITENVGATIEDSVNGYIVPIRNSTAIAEKIMCFYDKRDKVEEFGKNGNIMVKKYTWNKYGYDLLRFYTSLQ